MTAYFLVAYDVPCVIIMAGCHVLTINNVSHYVGLCVTGLADAQLLTIE